MAAAHALGARVTAHVFGEESLPDLIESGIDCLEHGTGLSLPLIDAMAAARPALVPTVVQLDNFPKYAAAGRRQVPAVRRAHDGPLGATSRDDRRGARGGRPDLRRHRRRRGACRTA